MYKLIFLELIVLDNFVIEFFLILDEILSEKKDVRLDEDEKCYLNI